MVEVDLIHIYKKYEGNDKYSVNDFDLHIKDKEFIVFVGPSGCGKSTTLRMVAGLEDISKGTLEIDHKVMNDVAPKDRNIAMVFQNYALYPHMSIYDNMAFGFTTRKMKLINGLNMLLKFWACLNTLIKSHRNCLVVKDSVLPQDVQLCEMHQSS